jgi:diguanylate cyclase (GGDEF)-like protein
MSDAACILILTDDPQYERRWAEILEPTGSRLWLGTSQLADDAKLDVIITDRPVVADLLASHNRRLARGEIGVIAIGAQCLADVSLPSNFICRELRVACLLLAEIVRLRREKRSAERQRKLLSQLALSDPLTGLPNRRAWEREIAARSKSWTTDRALCLCLIDLDSLKQINDNFGHDVGDKALKIAARALAESVRAGDYVARLGGDEFALLCEDLEPGNVFETVDRMRSSVCGSDLPDGCRLTASAGFAEARNCQIISTEELFAAASGALRRAKVQGRNRTVSA